MDSQIASALKLKHNPVVLTWTDEITEKTIMFAKGKQACALFLFAAAANGKTGACDRDTFGCFGAGVGLGFSNQYENFPGGVDGFCRFLSSGNQSDPAGTAVAERMKAFAPDHFVNDFLLGERYVKSPETVRKQFVEMLPLTDVPTRYALFQPLSAVTPETTSPLPRIVTFVANPDQLAALVVLANFAADRIDAVFTPFVAGCQAIGIMPLHEALSDQPRAVMGLIDISSRVNLLTSIGRGYFSLSAPWDLFLRMEESVEHSFLRRDTWKNLTQD